jgi:hypothetical protein
MMKQLKYGDPVELFGLWVYAHDRYKKAWVVCHPLWTDTHTRYQAARDAALARFPGYNIGRMNPFRALRRIADYVA